MFDPCDQEKYMDTEYGLIEESSEFVLLSNLKIVIERWISLQKKLFVVPIFLSSSNFTNFSDLSLAR